MSEYSETLETSEDGRYRVQLVLDEYPPEPYDDSQSPLIRLDYRHGWSAEHIQIGGRPTDADSYVEEALARWGSDFDLLEKYLRAYHGVTKVETWHSGSYWYITYDSAAWREWAGAAEGSADMSEYRAWCEGDVWGWVVEKNVTWTADDDRDDMSTWEAVDSCWGYYGRDGENGKYLESCAREALAYEAGPYAHMATAHEIGPDFLARWDRETVTRKHAQYHQMAREGKISVSHTHDDPHAPFAVTAGSAEPAPLVISQSTIDDVARVGREWPDGIHTCAELQELEPGRRPCTCGRCPAAKPDQEDGS